MNKKLLKNVLVISLLISMFACNDENEVNIIDPSAINATWKLTQVVNISDEDKYLNSVLEFELDHYTHVDNDGTIISEGSWRIEGDNLFLQFPLFEEGEEMKYRLMNLTSENLSLEEHYTLDNKDALLEYHFIQLE